MPAPETSLKPVVAPTLQTSKQASKQTHTHAHTPEHTHTIASTMTDAFNLDSEAMTPIDSRAYDRVALEEAVYTAESGSLRLLQDIEENRLSANTKIVYSSILFEFWMHVKDVKAKEPDSYGHCIREGLSKPRPMGPYDGLKFFIQSCPVDDVLFLSFLCHKGGR